MSRDFRPIFCLKFSTWAPEEQAKMVSRTFSFLQRYSIASPCSQQLRGQANFSLETDILYFKIIVIGFVNDPITFFHLIVPLKSVSSLQIFPKVSM